MVRIPAEQNLPGDDRVRLTYFRMSDAAALRDVDSDSEHRLRFEFPEDFVATLEHSQGVISDCTRARDEGGLFVFAVRSAVDSELLGGCEIRLKEDHVANVSYFTRPQHRASGLATRAVALVCQIAQSSLGVRILEIVTDPDNIASRRVAQRNGFHESGMRDGRILHLKNITCQTGK